MLLKIKICQITPVEKKFKLKFILAQHANAESRKEIRKHLTRQVARKMKYELPKVNHY